jgi:hypothetical protein
MKPSETANTRTVRLNSDNAIAITATRAFCR